MEANYQRLSPSSNLWLIKSLISCILFGIGSFLIGLNGLSPYLGKLLVSTGYLISGLASLLYSKLFHKEPISLKPEAGFLPSALCGSFNHFGNFSLFLGYHFDPQNQGIISIMAIGSAAVSAIASYFMYKEKLAAFDILGMTICILGLVTIGVFSNGESDNSLFGYSFGLCALGFYAVRNLCARKASVSGIDLYKSTVICVFFEAFTGFLNIAILAVFVQVFDKTQDFWITLIAGVLFGAGNFALNMAIMEGKIGPAVVIANCLGILQMGLDFGFRGFVPDSGKLVGGFVALVGVGVLLMWKEIVKK